MANGITGLTAATVDIEWWPLGVNCVQSMSQTKALDSCFLHPISKFDRPPHWFKVQLLLNKENGWYLWVDSDAKVIDTEFNLSSIIEDGKYLYISQDQNAINSGVFLININSKTKKFLQKVYDDTSSIGTPYQENTAIHKLIEQNYDNCRDWIRIIPSSIFNCYSNGQYEEVAFYISDKKPFIYHYPGGSSSDKQCRLLDYYIPNFRENIDKYFTDLDTVIEIGVCRGEFSYNKLQNICKNLILIDTWQNSPTYIDIENKPQHEQENDFNLVQSLFKKRAKIIRETSIKASDSFVDESIDLCYIDGDHSYLSVLNDIKSWWPKIKKGGWMFGHDYQNSKHNNTLIEVKSAVNAWFHENPKNTAFISNEENYKSWGIQKI